MLVGGLSSLGLDARLEDGAGWVDSYALSIGPGTVTSWDHDPPLIMNSAYGRLDSFRTMLRQLDSRLPHSKRLLLP